MYLDLYKNELVLVAQHVGSPSSASPMGAAPDTHPCGWCLTYDSMNSHARPSQQSHKGPQGATPRTRPLAPPPVGRRPQAEWTTHNSPRTLVPARSVKSTSLSNPGGPRRGCAAGQHTQHFGFFIPDTDAHRMPPIDMLGTSPGSRSSGSS